MNQHTPHVPLAPVVKENGVWTYPAPTPTDFFTREMLMREAMRLYAARRQNHPITTKAE